MFGRGVVDHHAFDFLPFGLLVEGLAFLDLPLEVLFFVLLLLVVLVVDPVVELGVVVRLVLPVHLLHLRACELYYFFVYHQLLDAVMLVEVVIDVCFRGVEWR